MTTLDDKLLPKVADILAKFGKVVTFTTSPPASAYDPTTGENAAFTATTHSVKITPPDEYNDKYIDGDLIQRGDVKVLVAGQGLPFTPTNGMAVVIDSKTWKIVSLKLIYSGESIAAYELQLRK